MAKYYNKKDLSKITETIVRLRKSKGWNIEDIAAMTGFSRNTISGIEKGANATTSQLIEIAKAIGIHPKELFDVAIELKPRFKLSASRKEKIKLTLKVNQLLSETNFFEETRFVSDVRSGLNEYYKIKAQPIQISVVLIRLVKDGKLTASKFGRKNSYTLNKRKR